MRFTLRHFLAGIAIIAIPLTFVSLSQDPYRSRRLHNYVYSVGFSPDGKKLAIAHYRARDAGVPFKCYVANVSNTTALIDVKSLSRATTILHEFHKGNQGPGGLFYRYASVAFAPKGEFLYALDHATRELRIWNIASANWTSDRDFDGTNVSDFRLSPDGNALAITSQDGIAIWNTYSPQPPFMRSDWQRLYTFSPDSKRIAVAKQNSVQIWDLSTQKLIRAFHENHDILDSMTCVAMSPDADTIALRCDEGLSLYSLRTGEKHNLLPELFEITRTATGWGTKSSGAHTTGISFSPDEKLLAAWGTYGLKFFDMSQNYTLQKTIPDNMIYCLAFSSDGKTIATGDGNGKLTIRDVASGSELRSTIIQP